MSTSNRRLEVEFRLWNVHPENGMEVVLVGSGPELGKWNSGNGRHAQFMSKEGCWSTVVQMEAHNTYQWKWVIFNSQGEFWEDCPNRQLELALIGGRADCDWNSPGGFQTDQCVFFASVHYRTSEFTDALTMLGSTPALGEWDSRCGVVAVEYPVGSGRWVARAVVEKGARQTWKWAVIDEHRNVKKWEARQNREFESEDDMVELATKWDSDSVIVEDIEPPENLYACYEKGMGSGKGFHSVQRWGY